LFKDGKWSQDRLGLKNASPDEDIHTIQPSPNPIEEHQVAAKNKSNEIRSGPITRARAKILDQ
jgi:hypothetical protein